MLALDAAQPALKAWVNEMRLTKMGYVQHYEMRIADATLGPEVRRVLQDLQELSVGSTMLRLGYLSEFSQLE